MNAKQRTTVFCFFLAGLSAISFSVSGCGPGQLFGSTFTPTPTITPTLTATQTLTATPTLTPTVTPTPTATPNLAATQQYETFFSLIQKYYDAKYIMSLKGTYKHLDDYSKSIAKVGEYDWNTMGLNAKNFIIKTHVTMSTANKPSLVTGCGIAFRTIDVAEIRFAQIAYIGQNGMARYLVNGDNFSPRFYEKVSNPAELDLVLIVNEKNIRFYINEKEALVLETFLKPSVGDLGFAVISGSNEDYGSRCDFTNTELWIINE